MSLSEQIKAKAKRFESIGMTHLVLVEDVLAILEPLMAHLQTFPLFKNLEENCIFPDVKRLLIWRTLVCQWKEELDKHMGAPTGAYVCIKRKRLERSLETLKGDSMDGAVMSVIDFRRFIEELLGDAPQKELKK